MRNNGMLPSNVSNPLSRLRSECQPVQACADWSLRMHWQKQHHSPRFCGTVMPDAQPLTCADATAELAAGSTNALESTVQACIARCCINVWKPEGALVPSAAFFLLISPRSCQHNGKLHGKTDIVDKSCVGQGIHPHKVCLCMCGILKMSR